MNYFSLFDIPEQYDINNDELERRFRLLQRLTHPDKYVTAGDHEKRLYMQKNAQVNDGYYVLNDIVARGLHLLEVRGVDLVSEQETIGDTVFLMEQMELREELASVTEPAQFAQLHKQVAEITANYVNKITLLLSENATESNHLAGIELSKLKFLKKLALEVKEREQNIHHV